MYMLYKLQLFFLFFFYKNTCIEDVGILILHMLNNEIIERLYKEEAKREARTRRSRWLRNSINKNKNKNKKKWQKK